MLKVKKGGLQMKPQPLFVVAGFVRVVRINFLSVAKRLGTVLRFTSSSYLTLNLVRGYNSVIISHDDWERLKTI